jgi:hypothetical protein
MKWQSFRFVPDVENDPVLLIPQDVFWLSHGRRKLRKQIEKINLPIIVDILDDVYI